MRQPYLQGYIIEPEKIRKFLGIQDPNDRRIDDVFCKILGALDLEKHPIHFHDRDEKTADVVLLLSSDAVADDIKTLEAKRLQPSNFMTQLANSFFTGPCILPYDINKVGSLSVWLNCSPNPGIGAEGPHRRWERKGVSGREQQALYPGGSCRSSLSTICCEYLRE
jgi:hypothetical protein